MSGFFRHRFGYGIHKPKPFAFIPSKVISGVVAGSTAWGHVTGVTQDNTRTFAGNWTGTGTIENSGDTERIRLTEGQYMESEVVDTEALETTLALNSYSSGDSVTVKYRTGATQALCEAASWSPYSAPFSSSGFAQVRLEA